MAAHAYSNDGLGSKTKDMDDTMITNDEHIFQGEALNHKPVIVKPPENGFKVWCSFYIFYHKWASKMGWFGSCFVRLCFGKDVCQWYHKLENPHLNPGFLRLQVRLARWVAVVSLLAGCSVVCVVHCCAILGYQWSIINHLEASLAIPFLRKPAGRPGWSYFWRSEFRGSRGVRADGVVRRCLEAHVAIGCTWRRSASIPLWSVDVCSLWGKEVSACPILCGTWGCSVSPEEAQHFNFSEMDISFPVLPIQLDVCLHVLGESCISQWNCPIIQSFNGLV